MTAEDRRERRFRKTCRCQSTSSGPRYIFESGNPADPRNTRAAEATVVTVLYVEMACDHCNAEWREEAPRG